MDIYAASGAIRIIGPFIQTNRKSTSKFGARELIHNELVDNQSFEYVTSTDGLLDENYKLALVKRQ